MPTRIDGDLFEAAKAVGSASSRSAAQQLSHWARIGREFEASPAISARDIQWVLAGKLSYDELSERDQAVVRAEWDEKIAARAAELNFADEFELAGRAWTEADERGNPVVRGGATTRA